jgi:tRNA nucleotidyltransferase (CCA-adding enzyme)
MKTQPKRWTAADLMQRDVKTVDADLPVPELEYTLVCAGISGAPVMQGKKVVGVVSRSDIVEVLTAEQEFGELVGEWYVDAVQDAGDAEQRKKLHATVGQRLQGMRVRDIMNPELISVDPGMPAAEIARAMLERGVHRVLVIEDDKLLGLITTSDMLRVLAEG